MSIVACACLSLGVPLIHAERGPMQGLGWVLTAYGTLAGGLAVAEWLVRLCV